MRSDYALYVVAIICFILAALIFVAHYAEYLLVPSEISFITTAVLAILGMISAGTGYLLRSEEILSPEPLFLASRTASPKPPSPSKTTATPPIEITEVRGIGAKRAGQLKALGISTAEDLSNNAATALAAQTDLSPKITRKWVREAKRLLKETS